MNGGEQTMLSYGVDTGRLARLGAPEETWRQAFAAALPEAHVRFFRSLQLSVAYGDYLFVHAGVRPGVPLTSQSEADLIWIRGPFLNHAEPFDKIVVHGHTPGHVSVLLESRGQKAMITGDIMHSPVQMARPDWGALVDADVTASEPETLYPVSSLLRLATCSVNSWFRCFSKSSCASS